MPKRYSLNRVTYCMYVRRHTAALPYHKDISLKTLCVNKHSVPLLLVPSTLLASDVLAALTAATTLTAAGALGGGDPSHAAPLGPGTRLARQSATLRRVRVFPVPGSGRSGGRPLTCTSFRYRSCTLSCCPLTQRLDHPDALATAPQPSSLIRLRLERQRSGRSHTRRHATRSLLTDDL